MPPRHGPTSTRLRHLGDDLLRHVLTHLRCDRLGNETVPGLIFEARVWRRLGKRFLRLSRDTPSKFDARIAYTKDGVLPRSFAGGLLCSPSSVGTVLEDDDASVNIIFDIFVRSGSVSFEICLKQMDDEEFEEAFHIQIYFLTTLTY